jgi:hypothetical protein
MRQTLLVAAIALGAATIGLAYFKGRTVDPSAGLGHPALERDSADEVVAADGRPSPAPQGDPPSSSIRPASKPASSDRRLAALQVSPDNGFIEFVVGADGKVIKEIDKNPSSLGFRKPSREYTYVGERVTGLTAYQYFGDHVQITRTAVSYKPDGSVDQYVESTSYDYGSGK